MFVTVAPGHLAHRIHACISVRFANTFVVVGLCQQVCLLHLLRPAVMSSMLVPDQWAVKHNCIRPSGMYVTVAPDQQSCLYMLHTISMHVSYSFILVASMNVYLHPAISHVCNNCIRSFVMYLTVAPYQQSCLLNMHLHACMSEKLAPDQY